MKTSLVAGIRRAEHIAVDESNTIGFLGDELRVYSTPSMVHDVEHACYRLIGGHLDPGETSLGVHVATDHIGATPIGHRVEIAVTVRSVEGRKVTLDAEVRDAVEVVGRGTHVRVVTEVERLRPTVGSKGERLDVAAAKRSSGVCAAANSRGTAPHHERKQVSTSGIGKQDGDVRTAKLVT